MPAGFTESDIIGITGHRNYPDRAALIRGLDNLRGREYVFGGARGVDTDALEYISKTQPRSIRTVIVPNRVINQPAISQTAIKNYSTNIIELRNTGANRFQLRNQAIVDRSTHLRAFYDFRGRGGTYNTIQYAKIKGKPYDVWPLNGFNERTLQSMSASETKSWLQRMKGLKAQFQALKGIIVQLINNHYQQDQTYFLEQMGLYGCKTLEEAWELLEAWE